jgi:hypothetical protein
VDRGRAWSTVDRPWTAAPGSPELRPPAAPVSTGAGQGAGEEEWNAGSSVGGSPGRGRQCGGVPAWERRREELGEGWEVPGVLGGFYRGRGGNRRGVARVTAVLMA